MDNLGRILMVEDDPNDVELTMTALEGYNLANEVVVTRDGEEALDYLYRRGKYTTRSSDHPAVILLDLKLPKIDGLEVLRQVKSDDNSEDDSSGGAYLLPRGKGSGLQLQTWRERLRG